MKYGKALFALVSCLIASSAIANELDRDAAVAPQSLIVRVDAAGNREVFKSNGQVQDQASAEAALAQVTAENRIQSVTAGSELDRTSSTEAWCYWYAPAYRGYYYYSYYNYAYNYGYNYYPTYNWYSYGYNYYYYYGYRY